MNKEEIIEGNKIIAEFEGLIKESELRRGKVVYLLNGSTTPFDEDCLLYHKNWNWLMPVLDKIERIADVEICIRGYRWDVKTDEKIIRNCIIRVPDRNGERDFETGGWEDYLFSINHSDDTKILATYKCVVEFIKWYNDSSITKI